MKKSYAEVVKALELGRTPAVFDYVNEGFRLVFKKPLALIGFTILALIVSAVVGEIHYTLDVLFGIFVQPVLLAGYYFYIDKIDQENESPVFNDLFQGFRERYLSFVGGNLLISIIAIVMFGIVSIPLIIILFDDLTSLGSPDDLEYIVANFLGLFMSYMFIFLVLAVYFTVCIMYMFPLIALTNVSVFQAVELSFKLAHKNLLAHVALAIMILVIAISGVLLLLIGLLVAIPVIYATIYAALNHLVGLRPEEDEDKLLDHLITN